MRCLECIFGPSATASKEDKQAATTISRYVRGRQGRDNAKMIKARAVLKSATLKVKSGLSAQPRLVTLSGDEAALQLAKPETSSTIINTLAFAEMKPTTPKGTSVVLAFTSGQKPVTFVAKDVKEAAAFSEAVNIFVEAASSS